jgi:hypothetical protein
MADTVLILGSFVFDGYEIPESIPFGGAQRLVTHQFPGGARTVQAMGRDDAAISWSGLFFGAGALDRAKFLDGMRVAGKSVMLRYLDFNYTVVVERFEANLKKFNRIPYSITLQVVQDNTNPVTSITPAGFDASLRADNTAAQGLGTQIGNATLNGYLATMNSAIASVSDFAKATTATIQSVVGPVGAVINVTKNLIGSTATVINSVTTLGGILPGNPIALQAAQSLNQATALTQSPLLVQLLNVSNRMQGNLGNISAGQQTKTVTVAGGTLYDVAAQQYGDATKWPTIAQANGLTDPLITGVQTLKIPTAAPVTGGVPAQ